MDDAIEDVTAVDSKLYIPHGVNQLAAKALRSEITYELISGTDGDGSIMPVVLGHGRYAKVFKAWQRSTGLNVRPVAIKILHEYLDRRSEPLFVDEIRLLKKLATASTTHVINIVDILRLGPMAMCGNCGQIYQPRCPKCGEYLLERFDPVGDAYPALRCPSVQRCKYIVSGEHILNSASVLFGFPAKTCCAQDKGPRAQRGTLINFVDREAVVMELLGQSLPQFQENRRRTYARICRQHGLVLPPPLGELGDSLSDPIPGVRGLQPVQPNDWEFIQKVMLLEKTLLLVQLAESVAWLHAEQQVVHKDIAADNIMVSAPLDDIDGDSDWRGLGQDGLGEALTSLATHPSFTAKVIDFGLADQMVLTRKWYEEPVQNFAAEKLCYLSLEARQRKRRIYQRIDFDIPSHKFVIPDSLRPDKAGEQAIKVGDLLVDESDPSHMYSLEVVGIEQDAQDRRIFRASYTGEVPQNPQVRQFDLVHRLGEAHDIYGLGAVFYFILTGEHTDVRKLTNIADLLQDAPQPLRADALSATVPSYKLCRERMPEKFYQDELMILILRAMVRGQPESFVQSRTDRGPEPARRLLQETRRIYNRLKAEILSAPVLRMLDDVQVAHRNLHENHRMLIRQVEQLHAAQEQLHSEKQGTQGALSEAARQKRHLLTALAVAALVATVGWGVTMRLLLEGESPASRPRQAQVQLEREGRTSG